MRYLFLGFIRLHLLHHASKEPIYGLDMIRELETHGYQVSPGTLYPILHGLEDRGYLRANSEVVNGKVRKLYTATDLGRQALSEGVVKAEELLRELRE
jgi:DNA-binding PadR family transcriptional regulator